MTDTRDKDRKPAKPPRKQAAKQQPAVKPDDPPEQKLGDTPVAPWDMPTPQEKQAAEPVRKALQEAVRKVDTPEKADDVVDKLESATAGETAKDVEQQQAGKAGPAQAARQVQQAAKAAPAGQKPARVLEETARALATPDAR